MTDLEENWDRCKTEYLRIAVEYHSAACAAVRSKQTNVAGLLAHYAVEMYLKARLVSKLTEGERARRSHSLTGLWSSLDLAPDVDSDHLHEAIAALDQFWELRYPESMLNTGMTLEVGYHRELATRQPVSPVGPDGPSPQYRLFVDDLDRIAHLAMKGFNVPFLALGPATLAELTYLNVMQTFGGTTS